MKQNNLPRDQYIELEQLPNIGPSIADDLRGIGIRRPSQLTGKDPYTLYDRVNRAQGVRQDPCLLDVFIAVVDFMNGEPARPWWKYTPERKRRLGIEPPKTRDSDSRSRRRG